MSNESVTEERLKLWFFRDLSAEQRLGLFRLMEMPVDEIGQTHGHQQIALNHVLQSFRSKPVANGVEIKPLEWEENSPNSVWTGELAFGVYYVAWDERTGWRAFRKQFLSEATEVEIAYGDKAVVLAAAEADYRNRIMSAPLPKATGPEVSEPVAWQVRREGNVEWSTVSARDVNGYSDRYERRPLFTSPQPLPEVTEEAVKRLAYKFQSIMSIKLSVDDDEGDHEIMGTGPASFEMARAALEAFVKGE